VLCCQGNAEEALAAMRRIMTGLKLTVNEEKTHICRVPQEHFDFLGYQFGRFYTKTGKAYWGSRPSPKSVKRLIQSIHEQTDHRMCLLEAKDLVDNLNRRLRGWANYFKLGPVSKPYRKVDLYTKARLRPHHEGQNYFRRPGVRRPQGVPHHFLAPRRNIHSLWHYLASPRVYSCRARLTSSERSRF